MSSLQQNWRKGQNRFCLEATGRGGRRSRGREAGGRNGPNNEYINQNKQILKNIIIQTK
jgi:hypothetical protein